MNGIHEVAGSIPVWSTNLRSPEVSFGWQASVLMSLTREGFRRSTQREGR